MSIQNSTLHFHFPLVVGSDRPVFSDYNATMELLDEQLYSAVSSITTFGEQIAALQETSGEHTTELSNLNAFQTEQEGINSANANRFLAINQALAEQVVTNNNKFNSVSIADAYDATRTYSVGDVVTYNGDRYRCITAVTTGEPFDADKWQGEDVQTELDALNSGLHLKEVRHVILATGDGVKTMSTLLAEALSNLRQLTPLYRLFSVHRYILPRTTSVKVSFVPSSDDTPRADLTNRVIRGFTTIITSGLVVNYSVDAETDTTTYCSVSVNSSSTVTYTDREDLVPAAGVTLEVVLNEYA